MAAEPLNNLVRQICQAVRWSPDGGATDAELLQRFVTHRDEAAFAALVRRYGPLVFGVCRRVLHHRQDAEDAFQATFLVLVHKARSIAQPELLGNWLYGVAYYTAKNAKASVVRRRARERRVMEMSHARLVADEEVQRELRWLLDEELSRLPEKYRVPVVLCELQGKSRKEVARLLGCPEGTVSSRLARARQLLRARLTKDGLDLSSGSFVVALSKQSASESVPALLVASTIQTAMRVVASQNTLAGVVSTQVATLTEGVLKTMFLAKLRLVTATLLATSLLIGAGVLAHQVLAAKPAPPENSTALANRKPRNASAEPEAAAPAPGRLEGRFTAADTGKPVAGVKVRVLTLGLPGKAVFADASSDTDGRYALAVPLGHCQLWGVYAPAGYYTQEAKTFGMVVTTTAEPRVVRDFVLKPGMQWHVALQGVTPPADQPPSFSALSDPERPWFASGEGISAIGDARSKAVLTIPSAGGRYRFSCGLMTIPSRYEIPSANLEIDKEFDPCTIKGTPEPLVERKAVRLRDGAGRVAIVEGVEVAVEAGQAVLRFAAQPIPTATALLLRGAAVDEAGKPIANAKVTAAFERGGGGSMSNLETRTDAQGKFEMPNVLLPQSSFEADSRIRMIVVQEGFDGAQTKELNLLEVKQAGSGDFGTVVLKPGRILRGKVVDEFARPLYGAVVTNHTNYFLYSHLRCRTDAEGRFLMPDLSFGRQKLWAQYGERSGEEEFHFDANSGECLITARLRPKSGIRQGATPAPVGGTRPSAAVPVKPVQQDSAWDLTPPVKEPSYRNEPRYALLVFGPQREERVWMVLDGTTLYVDGNGNGDLTEPDKRLDPNNPTDGSNRFGNPGSHTHFDVFEFTVRAGATGTSKFRLDHWIRAENFTPKSDFEKHRHAKWLEGRWETSTLWRQEGLGQGQTPLLFMPKPADAQVCAFDGPLTFVVKMPERQVLQRGEAGSDLAFHIAVIGRPHRGAEQQFYNTLATKEVPEGAHLEVEIEYPAKAPQTPPLRRRFLLKQRGGGDTFHGPVRVPEEAGSGVAKVTVHMRDWPDRQVQPATVAVPIED